MVPLSGQTTVQSGNKIIVALPPSSLVDLSTFEMNFKGYTHTAEMEQHGQPLQELQQIQLIMLINDIFHVI